MYDFLCRTSVPLFLCLSILPTAADPMIPEELMVQPLSLTISKLPRDNFGEGTSPFGGSMNHEISGVSILVQIQKPQTFNAHLSNKGATLTSLKDDKGKDLSKLPGEQKINEFWENNQPITVLSPRSTTGPEGLRLRGAVTPSPGATKILAEGTLTYALVGEAQQEEHRAVRLTEGAMLENEAAKLKLSKGKPDRNGKALWWIEIQPRPQAVNVELKLFGKDDDDLLLDTGGQRPKYWRNMNGILSYGIEHNGNILHKIVIHHAQNGEKVKVPFTLEVGLGDLPVEEEDREGKPNSRRRRGF